MARKYYTLCIRFDGKWSPEFGDYSREVVQEEMETESYLRKNMRIITTGARQSDITTAVASLNSAKDA
jgi:hypothetical protein